jgi:aryl sulfotransferase
MVRESAVRGSAKVCAVLVPVPKIIWLASYPKSGNTWMRILLTNYVRDASVPADINQLDGGPLASARACFDEWVGIEASTLEDGVIEQLRPQVFRCLLREATDTLYMKVHDAWGRTSRGDALFPPDVTAGVVYMLRNPLDVAPSCSHHWGVSIAQAVENLCAPAFAVARSRDGLADQLRQKLRCWTGHAQSWLEESGLRIHLVRYEDLRRDPEAVFGGVVRFCGLPWDAARMRKAVTFSAFSGLRDQEQTHGFRERPLRSSGPFFRGGKSGSWRDELPLNLAEQLIQTHGASMRRFGYLDANHQPI